MQEHSQRYCRFCKYKGMTIDYKDAKALKPFLTERDKILPRRMTSLCAYHQRKVTMALKRARVLGIIPFSASQRETL